MAIESGKFIGFVCGIDDGAVFFSGFVFWLLEYWLVIKIRCFEFNENGGRRRWKSVLEICGCIWEESREIERDICAGAYWKWDNGGL